MYKARNKEFCPIWAWVVMGMVGLIGLAGCSASPAALKAESVSESKPVTGFIDEDSPVTTTAKDDAAIYEKSLPMENEGMAIADTQAPKAKKQAKSEQNLTTSPVKETAKSTSQQEVAKTSPDASKKDAKDASTETSEKTSPRVDRQPVIKYLSADDSNSCASPVIVRKLINSGKYVQPAVIRTYEFLNYYSFTYPAPDNSPVSLLAAMRKTEDAGKYSLQVAVRSRNKHWAELPPMNVIFLVDVSGSMAGEPINLARRFLESFAGKLRPRDILSIVICNRQARVVLDSYQYNAGLAAKLTNEVFPLFVPNDITNLEEGITTAYQLAGKNYQAAFLNRVILLSDGAANTGKTAPELVARHAEDSDKQGIYLAGLGVGEGFNDALMNTFTDKGRGAYLFLDSKEEVARILEDDNFLANFDLAVKDVRLKMVIPPYWKMEEFHGEQVSSKASEVIPQYLAPNDQMIYHLVMSAETDSKQAVLAAAEEQSFEFEAEYRPIGGRVQKANLKIKVADMLTNQAQILKGDAIVAYAEFFKKVKYPLETEVNRTENLKEYEKCLAQITNLNTALSDPELDGLVALLKKYERTLKFGEQFTGREDKTLDTPAAVLGISPNEVLDTRISGRAADAAVKPLSRLLRSQRLVPQEGYKFLALSSGPVGNPTPSGAGDLGAGDGPDPAPEYIGYKKAAGSRQRVFDLHQVVLTLKAPRSAKSFSFDFNFFSAEYPAYINQNYNDTFYAILEAASTNNGKKTNISFDPNNKPMEVDNNYFENPFHPIPNTGTGFDRHGSTGWLRTSWPIQGGETFKLTFSIHDEGDAVYDSLVLLDNFQWHSYEAVGTTDPLN